MNVGFWLLLHKGNVTNLMMDSKFASEKSKHSTEQLSFIDSSVIMKQSNYLFHFKYISKSMIKKYDFFFVMGQVSAFLNKICFSLFSQGACFHLYKIEYLVHFISHQLYVKCFYKSRTNITVWLCIQVKGSHYIPGKF